MLAKVVGEEHFGGFLTKVDSAASEEKKKTWKEKMEEIISKSKKAKVLCFTSFSVYLCVLCLLQCHENAHCIFLDLCFFLLRWHV